MASITLTSRQQTYLDGAPGSPVVNPPQAMKLGSLLASRDPGSWFKSAETAGTGGAQSIAHGLGRVPVLVLVMPTELTGGVYDVAEGVHDVTNIKVTVTAGEKFKVIAV